MEGKYRNPLTFAFTVARRSILRSLLRRLLAWSPPDDPREGYTVIIGALQKLPSLLLANLRCLMRQERAGLGEILIVLDGPESPDLERRVAGELDGVPHRVLRYTPRQVRRSEFVDWPWVNSWLSWSIGISETRTRHAVLQDLDAMLVKPDFLESRYRAIRSGGAQYLGTRWYEGNGIVREDELVTTFEMFFDAAFVRERFRPIDLFNHVAMHGGRSVEFDTFLHAQSRGGAKRVIDAHLDDMVHPSQLICQFKYHLSGDPRLTRTGHSLMLLPYFSYLGGEEGMLRELTGALARKQGSRVELFERPLDLGALAPDHVAWLVKQTRHLERSLFGDVRPDVRAYLDAFQEFVRTPASVGA